MHIEDRLQSIEAKVDAIFAKLVAAPGPAGNLTFFVPAALEGGAAPAVAAGVLQGTGQTPPMQQRTVADVKAAVTAAGKKLVTANRPKLLEVLKNLGVERLSALPDEKLADAEAALNAALAPNK